VLAAAGEFQIFGQVGINQTTAVARLRLPFGDRLAGFQQIGLIGIGLLQAERLDGP